MLNPKHAPRWGTDPEVFFSYDGRIIGSEKLISKSGLRTYSGKVIRDGVQCELQPLSAATIPELGGNISGLFLALQRKLAKNPGVSVDFSGLVEVSEEELDSLSSDTRILGCNPSENVYGNRGITVDPILYRKRSSGGHIHVGTDDPVFIRDRREAVYAFDIIVGNTCVLLDRDPGAAERRENYGRAGEFRTPDHGLEYRTISNFWLRDYTLMHTVFSLAHLAYATAFAGLNGDTALWEGLATAANLEKIQTAINRNDTTLAMQNLKRLVPFLRKHLPKEGFILSGKTLDSFISFCGDSANGKLSEYFPEDGIISRWVEGKQLGITEFLTR